jgi:uncharacterized repeat protein (TIGR02543 family)
MPATVNEKVLIGEDAEFGQTTLADSEALAVINGLVRIKAKGGTSALPAYLSVGDWWYAHEVTLLEDDVVQLPTYVTFADITSVTVNGSKAQIDTTRLADVQKGSRTGKSEQSGSFEGFRTSGGTAAEQTVRNLFLSKMVDVMDMNNGAKSPINDDILWIFAYLNTNTKDDELQEVYIAPIRITQLDVFNVSVDGVQTLSGSFVVDGTTGNAQIVQYKNPYTITYVLDGGTNDEDNPDSYTFTTPTITLEPATKALHTFNGWFSNAAKTVEVTNIPVGSQGNITLYAKFTLD